MIRPQADNQVYSTTRGYLTSDQNDHLNPSINNRGDVVWEQTDPMSGLNQIYGIIGGVSTQITSDAAWHSQPSISNSGEVVWAQSQWQGSNDSRIYSNTRGQVTHDCPFGWGHSEPSVNSCGDLTFTNFGNIYRLGSNSPCATEPEPNNNREQAVAVGGNSATTGALDATADMEDWYSFTANAGEQIKISVNWPATPPNMLFVELLDANGQLMMNSGSNPMVLNTVAPFAGTYYVRLTAPVGQFGYNLSVKVGTGTGACADPVSPGSPPQTGSAVNDLGEMVWSQLDPATNNTQIYSSMRGQLTSELNPHNTPSLNNRGDVVWEQGNWITGIIQGAPVSIGPGTNPSINDSGEVVWDQYDSNTGNVAIYSSVRGLLSQAPAFSPAINNNGDVVWVQSDGSGFNQIFVDIAGVITQITFDQEHHSDPFISNSGEVVWSQSRMTTEGQRRIFSSTRGQLTHDCPFGWGHSEPSVNSCGDLSFTNFGSNGPAIYRLGSNSPCATYPGANDTQAQASPVFLGNIFTGLMDIAANPVDWYRFDANAGDNIHIELSYDTRPQNTLNIGLYDSQGNLISGPTSSTPLGIHIMTSYSGSYYLKVETGSGRFGYSVSLSAIKPADTTPPTTSVTLTAGTYSSPQTTTLSCNDGAGSGCAVTYYCLGTGCTPSTLYSGDIIINSSTDLRFYSTDAAGNIEVVQTVNYIIDPSDYTLSIQFSGSGGGTVTSTPDGIACNTNCSNTFATGTPVTLHSSSTAGSSFVGWSNGLCSGTGDCLLVLNTDMSVTANFDQEVVPRVKLDGSLTGFFFTIQDACEAAETDSIIKLQSSEFSEYLTWNRLATVILRGGYDDSYNTFVGVTNLRGSLTIAGGTIIVDGISIQ